MGNKTSKKKIESNRLNALKSTGPRTLSGKRAARLNAVKHGILAKGLLFDGPDEQEQFEDMFQGLKDELRPDGTMEQMQVYIIASCYWKLKMGDRCDRFEAGEVRKAISEFEMTHPIATSTDLARAKEEFHSKGSTDKLKQSSKGVAYLIETLLEIRK